MATNTDFTSFLSTRVKTELESEEEILDEILEDNEVKDIHSDFLDAGQEAKCGSILISTTRKYTLVCESCDGRFDSMEAFGYHLEKDHFDYGVRNGGWCRIPIKEEVVFKTEDIQNKECTATNFDATYLPKISIFEESAMNAFQTFPLQSSNNSSVISRRPTVVLTGQPLYDEKKNFCITCDRQLESKKSFYRHKYYHKEMFRKQDRLHLQYPGPNGALVETVVKEELDIGNYEVQNPGFPEAYNETYIHPGAVGNPIDPAAEHLRSTQMNSPSLHCDTTRTSYDELQPKLNTSVDINAQYSHHVQAINMAEIQLGSAVQNEQLFCPESSQQYEADKNQAAEFNHNAAEMGESSEYGQHENDPDAPRRGRKKGKVVFSFEPEFDKARNFCITCNRQMSSGESFKHHEYDHKFKIRKWYIANGLKSRKEQVKFVFSENPSFDDERNFCITCNREFDTKIGFQLHKKRHRLKIREKQGTVSTSEATFSCELCPGKFKSDFCLRRHTVSSHGDKIPNSLQGDPTYLRCRFCHKDFEKPTERHQHERDHANERARYRCHLCPKSFTTSAGRKAHKTIHRGDRPFLCSQCPKAFGARANLYRHVQCIHSGIKPFACEYCGKTFSEKSDLTSHIVSHTKEKPHECQECGARFSYLQSLRIHKKRHANQRDFKCEVCGKLFTTNSELRDHRTIHSEGCDFQCPHCQKRFKRKSTLRAHKKLHESEQMYRCMMCDIKFANEGELNLHMESHSG